MLGKLRLNISLIHKLQLLSMEMFEGNPQSTNVQEAYCQHHQKTTTWRRLVRPQEIRRIWQRKVAHLHWNLFWKETCWLSVIQAETKRVALAPDEKRKLWKPQRKCSWIHWCTSQRNFSGRTWIWEWPAGPVSCHHSAALCSIDASPREKLMQAHENSKEIKTPVTVVTRYGTCISRPSY